MEWVQQNGLTVLLTLLFLVLALKNPVMARIYGVRSISVHELAKRLGNKPAPLLIDVRTPMEFNSGHIPGARNEPLGELSRRIEALRQLAQGREVAVVCRSGARSLGGAVMLKKAGCETVYNVAGGMLQWQSQGYQARG
ncbi:Thiosulfate sulfurtransferase GlpE [Candidatus Magnetaquicoccaceae bacterium FCR-1]|uniref:Thiosulfate sulfurtransferase GlpE n=1 Tax=Candidatus Magnetaquiglobus chichijimensis TaxID=3141448 RepID=A0ABQ0C4V9_9PROT